MAAALDDAAAALRPPGGAFLLATDAVGVLGCGGVYRLGATTAEAKRMWVHRRARGAGLGRRMLAALEDAARELGCRDVAPDSCRPDYYCPDYRCPDYRCPTYCR